MIGKKRWPVYEMMVCSGYLTEHIVISQIGRLFLCEKIVFVCITIERKMTLYQTIMF